MWMVDGIHHDTAHCWPDTTPTRGTGFTELAQTVLAISDTADHGATIGMDAAHFTGAKPQGGIAAFTRDELDGSAGRARELGAFARP
jgi:hypothetical protein